MNDDTEPVRAALASLDGTVEAHNAAWRTAQPAAEPGDVEAAVELLAGVRCQLLHEQIACAYCANCLSWARHVALPQWGPGLARHDDEVAARALEDAANDFDLGWNRGHDNSVHPYSHILRERAAAIRGGDQ